MTIRLIRPSYHQGFYSPQRGGIPLNPNLWHGLVYAGAPSLGITGNRLLDQSGLSRHGTNISVDWKITEEGYVLDQNAETDRVEVGGQLLSNLTNCSFFTSIKTTAAGKSGGRAIYAERAASGNNIWKLDSLDLGHDADGLQFTHRNDGSLLTFISNGSITINDGLLHIIGFTKVGTSIKCYVDSVLDANGTLNGGDDLTNANIEAWIGSDPAATSAGSIAEIGNSFGWNRALILNEIKQHTEDQFALFRTRRIIGRTPVAPPAGATLRTLSLLGAGV